MRRGLNKARAGLCYPRLNRRSPDLAGRLCTVETCDTSRSGTNALPTLGVDRCFGALPVVRRGHLGVSAAQLVLRSLRSRLGT